MLDILYELSPEEKENTNILNNRKVSNKAALENPEILVFYQEQAKYLRET